MARFILFLSFLLVFFFSCKKINSEEKISQNAKRNDVFLVPMQVGTQWGLTDTLGNIKVSPQYDEVIDFDIDTIMGEPTRSYYLMRKGNTLHYIDSNNKRYFTNFEIVQDSDKNIFYKKNNRVGFTRPSFVNGEWQIDENPDSYPYDKITRLKDKLFSYSIVKTANKVGLLEYETKTVIPLQYDSLDYSVQAETATFTAYRLKEKKIISTERFPIDLRLPPPPTTKNKITSEELLKMEKVPDGEGSALLKRYKDISRVKETLNPIVVKDNESKRYAIFDRYSKQPLEFKYDLVIPGLDINQKSYKVDKYFIVNKDSKYALYSADYNKESSYYDLIEQRTFYNHYGSFVSYIVAKNKGKMGMILFDSRKKEFKESIPFRFDNINDRDIVINKGLYGVYDVEKSTLKIPCIYKIKPEIFKIISYYGRRYKIYQAVNKNNVKVSILSNGLELYRNK